MKILHLLIPVALMGLLGCSQKKAETPAQTPAGLLRARLEKSMADSVVIFGHHDDPVYGHSWNGDENRSDIKDMTGMYPGMMSWDLGGLENADTANLDSVPFDRIRREAVAQDARGGFNTFSWHLRHALTNGDSWTVADSLVRVLLHTPAGQTAFRTQIDRVADFLLSIKDAQGNRIGVIFRPWHEHTGGWFWWGASNCSVDDYKALWTTIRERFDEKGVDNVLWAYSPGSVENSEQYFERYPGDEYIDILGSDIYSYTDSTYIRDTDIELPVVIKEAALRHKIPAFTETGLESVKDSVWYTQTLLPIITKYPVAYVTVWRNAHDKPMHYYAPFPGHPAESDFVEFARNPRTKFVK